MSTAEILTIGSELIEGLRVNTNATWLAKNLAAQGVQVTRITSVADDSTQIAKAVREAISRKTGLLIVTGGLGPTPDDKTLEAVGKAIGSELALDEKALKLVRESYSRARTRGLVKSERLTKARKKMAHLPKGASPLSNPVGAAPGVQLRCNETLIICMPGVPVEMQAIFDQHVKSTLAQIGGQKRATAEIIVKSGDESAIVPLFDKLARKFPTVEVRSYPSEDEVRIVLVSTNAGEVKAAKRMLSELLQETH